MGFELKNKDILNGGAGHDIKINYNIKFHPLSAGTRITSWKVMNESYLYRFLVTFGTWRMDF